jgi:hypothetical protein
MKKRIAIWTGFLVAMLNPGLMSAADSRQELSEQGLFNGRDLSAWEPVGKEGATNWSVSDGELICLGKGHCWLRSRRQYGDFTMHLEYRVAAGANSGVYVRVPADGNHHRESSSAPPAGFEVQILDDRSPKHADLKDYQYSASLYDIAGASPRNSRPAGRWNTLEICCLGQHVTITQNGVQVVDARDNKYPLLKLRSLNGYLGIQSHNGIVHFRNLRIAVHGRAKEIRD